MEQGLSQSSILAIAQCGDSFIWFGTQYGLDRYDGHDFRTWRHEPGNPSSLSNSNVSDLLWSGLGHLWVATAKGLDRFDTRAGRAERFPLPPMAVARTHEQGALTIVGEGQDGTVYLKYLDQVVILRPERSQLEMVPFQQPLSIDSEFGSSALLDGEGRLWLYNGAGLWRLNLDQLHMERVRPHVSARASPLYQSLALTADGLLAIAADDQLKLLDPDSLDVVRQISLTDMGSGEAQFNAIMAASDGSLWLATATRLVRYDPASHDWQVKFQNSQLRMPENTRKTLIMAEHPNGDLWFAGQHGVARWDANSDTVSLFRHDPRDTYSIPPTSLGTGYSLFIDYNQSVWVGSRLGGLARYSPMDSLFEHLLDAGSIADLPYAGLNVVRGVAEQMVDDHEYLWLALDYGGVLRFLRRDVNDYTWISSFHSLAEQGHTLPGDMVLDIVADPQSETVWVLESSHLVAIDARSDQVVGKIEVAGDADVRVNSTSLAISEDGSALLVGTRSGVYVFYINEDRVSLSPDHGHPFLPDRWVTNLMTLERQRVMVGDLDGFAIFDFASPSKEPLLEQSLDDAVFGLARHHENGWWIGTRESGLVHAWPTGDENGRINVDTERYGMGDGLVDETIYAILPQDDGQLWMSSNRGLMRWNPIDRQVRHFTPADGAQSFEFNSAVATKGASGRFYFGGINGVNIFRPGQIRELGSPPRVHLQEVVVGDEQIPGVPGVATRLKLRHDQNNLQLQFVGLDFVDPNRVRYAYRLEGLDTDWVDAGIQRQVRFAGLAPGHYRFFVRAAKSDGVWSEETLLLSAVIHPTLWKTGWAYLAYVILVLAVASLAYGLHLDRRKLLESEVRLRTAELVEKQAIVRRQAIQLEQALAARTLFFANISHEFRTPLTLIEASIAKLGDEGGDSSAVERGQRYLRQLLQLVDQLLEHAHLGTSEDLIDGPSWPLAPVVGSTVDSFQALAEQNKIVLEAEIESGWLTKCSQAHVDQVLHNLLTNALKFSPPGSKVDVSLTGGVEEVMLEVADNGPGIPSPDQALIFRRFYRSEASAGVSGAGIGLALVHDTVRAMGGRIELKSEPGRGSRFTVYLPAWTKGSESAPAPSAGQSTAVEGIDRVHEQHGCVLVVDNNTEMRQYLREILSEQWHVLEANSGEAALELARTDAPDVIVSDLMMPGMDGFELLAAIREDIETSHIPLLLLTARQDRATRLKGLSLSVDDFLPKPFDPRELRLRLVRMLDNRLRLRQRLSGEARKDDSLSQSAASDLSACDRKLLGAVNDSLNKYASDPDFTVEALAESVLLERRTLQRKLKTLTGLTPADYLRQHRFYQARQMMLETELSVNEIAFSCGFGSAQHFSRTFRKHYGLPPDKWRQNQKADLKF